MNPEVASENPSSLGDKTYWNNVTCSSERLTNSNYTAEINCSQPSESWIDLLSSVAREVTDHKAKRRRIRSDDGYSSESNTSETESEMNGTSRPWISQASQTPIAVYHGSTEQNTSERIITETNKKIMSEDEHVRPGVAFAEDLSWDTPSLNTEESSTPVYYPPPDGQKPLNESLTDYTESFEVSADEIAAAIHTSADTPSATSSEALLNHFVDVASQMARSSSKHQFPADADAISSSFTTAAVAAAAAGALLGFDTVDSSADILKSNIFNTLDIWDKAKENLKLFGLTLPPLKKSPSNSNSEEIHTELISKEGAQKSPSTDISEGSDVNRTKTNNSEDTPTPECQENALSALQPHLDFLSEGFKADDGQWYRRPDISEECLNDLCDLTELKGRISPGTKIEYTYTKGISFALGEGGRELLRACLNAKGCKGRQLQGASVPMLLQLAHEWRLWNIALRIKVERVTGSLCPKHEAFVRFKAVQTESEEETEVEDDDEDETATAENDNEAEDKRDEEENDNDDDNADDDDDDIDDEEEEEEEEKISLEPKVLPIRETRGRRVQVLSNDEDEFWDHDTWKEEKDDEEWSTEDERHYEDVMDSDFSDNDDGKDDEIDEFAGEKLLAEAAKKEKKMNQKKQAYQDPRKMAKEGAKYLKLKMKSVASRPQPPPPALPKNLITQKNSMKKGNRKLLSQEDHLMMAALTEKQNTKTLTERLDHENWKKAVKEQKESSTVWTGTMELMISWASDRIIESEKKKIPENTPVYARDMLFFVDFTNPIKSSIPALYTRSLPNKPRVRYCSVNPNVIARYKDPKTNEFFSDLSAYRILKERQNETEYNKKIEKKIECIETKIRKIISYMKLHVLFPNIPDSVDEEHSLDYLRSTVSSITTNLPEVSPEVCTDKEEENNTLNKSNLLDGKKQKRIRKTQLNDDGNNCSLVTKRIKTVNEKQIIQTKPNIDPIPTTSLQQTIVSDQTQMYPNPITPFPSTTVSSSPPKQPRVKRQPLRIRSTSHGGTPQQPQQPTQQFSGYTEVFNGFPPGMLIRPRPSYQTTPLPMLDPMALFSMGASIGAPLGTPMMPFQYENPYTSFQPTPESFAIAMMRNNQNLSDRLHMPGVTPMPWQNHRLGDPRANTAYMTAGRPCYIPPNAPRADTRQDPNNRNATHDIFSTLPPVCCFPVSQSTFPYTPAYRPHPQMYEKITSPNHLSRMRQPSNNITTISSSKIISNSIPNETCEVQTKGVIIRPDQKTEQ